MQQHRLEMALELEERGFPPDVVSRLESDAWFCAAMLSLQAGKMPEHIRDVLIQATGNFPNPKSAETLPVFFNASHAYADAPIRQLSIEQSFLDERIATTNAYPDLKDWFTGQQIVLSKEIANNAELLEQAPQRLHRDLTNLLNMPDNIRCQDVRRSALAVQPVLSDDQQEEAEEEAGPAPNA